MDFALGHQETPKPPSGGFLSWRPQDAMGKWSDSTQLEVQCNEKTI